MREPVRRAVAVPDGDRIVRLTSQPHQVDVPGGWSGWGGRIAALVAFGLGAVAAVMMIAGHPPWEGETVLVVTSTHGLHRGDVVALIPLIAGTGLGFWCLQRPSVRTLQVLFEASAPPGADPGR